MGNMATPYKDPKSDIYYIRIVVPQDVRKLIGEREFKKTSEARNQREANIKKLPFKEVAYSRIERRGESYLVTMIHPLFPKIARP